MNRASRPPIVTLLTGLLLLSTAFVGATLAASVTAQAASAHGSTQTPASRVYTCRFENPNDPMCAAAWSSNSQALYDWMEVNIGDAAGRHQELIPDGQLCSAGRQKYAAFDRPGDWPVTALSSDGSGLVDLVYQNTAPHATEYYRVYITGNGFDARTDSLAWSDLELVYDSGRLDRAAQQTMRAPLPNRDVPAVLYIVWQRSDSPEAFYACSDVTVNGEAPSPPTSTTSPPSTSTPNTSAPSSSTSATSPTTPPPTTGASTTTTTSPPATALPPTSTPATAPPSSSPSSTTMLASTTAQATTSASTTSTPTSATSVSTTTAAALSTATPLTDAAAIGSDQVSTIPLQDSGSMTAPTTGTTSSVERPDEEDEANTAEPELASLVSVDDSGPDIQTAPATAAGTPGRSRWTFILSLVALSSGGLVLLGIRLRWADKLDRLIASITKRPTLRPSSGGPSPLADLRTARHYDVPDASG